VSDTTELTFLVQGSEVEPYRVRFVTNGDGHLTAYCTCAAGQQGQFCKHRLAILQGDPSAVVSDNTGDVHTVHTWVPGSNVEAAMQHIVACEAAVEQAKRQLTAAKKALSASMRR
jgi:hypothetical protein